MKLGVLTLVVLAGCTSGTELGNELRWAVPHSWSVRSCDGPDLCARDGADPPASLVIVHTDTQNPVTGDEVRRTIEALKKQGQFEINDANIGTCWDGARGRVPCMEIKSWNHEGFYTVTYGWRDEKRKVNVAVAYSILRKWIDLERTASKTMGWQVTKHVCFGSTRESGHCYKEWE